MECKRKMKICFKRTLKDLRMEKAGQPVKGHKCGGNIIYERK